MNYQPLKKIATLVLTFTLPGSIILFSLRIYKSGAKPGSEIFDAAVSDGLVGFSCISVALIALFSLLGFLQRR